MNVKYGFLRSLNKAYVLRSLENANHNGLAWTSFQTRPIGVLNRYTELRYSKVKYKFIFYNWRRSRCRRRHYYISVRTQTGFVVHLFFASKQILVKMKYIYFFSFHQTTHWSVNLRKIVQLPLEIIRTKQLWKIALNVCFYQPRLAQYWINR